MRSRPTAFSPLHSPPARPSPAPFAVHASTPTTPAIDASFAFMIASNAPVPTRPGGNAAALASPTTSAAFTALFSDFETGAVTLDGFRARMRSLGVCETPEATRILSQAGHIRLAELKAALRRSGAEDGGIGGSGTVAGGVRSSAAYFSTSALGDIDNRAAGRALGLVARGEHAPYGAFEESGVGALLAGRGDTLPRAATSDVSPTADLSQHASKLRSLRTVEYIDSDAVRDVLTNSFALPAAADGARARARSLLSQIDAGAVREADLPGRLLEMTGVSLNDVPDLAPIFRAFYRTGKLDLQRAIVLLNTVLAEKSKSNGDVDDAISVSLRDSMTFRSPARGGGGGVSSNSTSTSMVENQMGSPAWAHELPHAAPAFAAHHRHHQLAPEDDPALSRSARSAAARHKILGTTELAPPPPPLPHDHCPPYAENDASSRQSAAAAWGRPRGGPMAYGIFSDPHAPAATAAQISQRRDDKIELAAQVDRGQQLQKMSASPLVFLSPERAAVSEGYKFRV